MSRIKMIFFLLFEKTNVFLALSYVLFQYLIIPQTLSFFLKHNRTFPGDISEPLYTHSASFVLSFPSNKCSVILENILEMLCCFCIEHRCRD